MSVEGMDTRDGEGEEESLCTAGDEGTVQFFDVARYENFVDDDEEDDDSWNASSEYHTEARETPPTFETSEG